MYFWHKFLDVRPIIDAGIPLLVCLTFCALMFGLKHIFSGWNIGNWASYLLYFITVTVYFALLFLSALASSFSVSSSPKTLYDIIFEIAFLPAFCLGLASIIGLFIRTYLPLYALTVMGVLGIVFYLSSLVINTFTPPIFYAIKDCDKQKVAAILETKPEEAKRKYKGEDIILGVFHCTGYESYKTIIDMLDNLLKAGADINAKSKNGTTPLFTAIATHNPEVANYLLSKGANIGVKDKQGNTALIQAVLSGEKALLIRLITAGIEVNIKNNEGKNALDLAKEREESELAKLLQMPLAELKAQYPQYFSDQK